MNANHRRRVSGLTGIAVGALLGAPLIALAASPIANADDDTTIGPAAAIGLPNGVTQTLYGDIVTTDSTTGQSNVFYSVPGFDNDYYSDPGANTYEDVLTVPGSFQEVITDANGVFTISPLDTTPADFIGIDPGLLDILPSTF